MKRRLNVLTVVSLSTFALALPFAASSLADDMPSEQPGMTGTEDTSATEGEQPGKKATLDLTSPSKACNSLVQAAKLGDFESFKSASVGWDMMYRHKGEAAGKVGKKDMEAKMEKDFHKMNREHMSKLKDLSCGTEHIVQNRAMVEAETQGEKRLIPFIQRDGKWMFDAQTYTSFYRDSMPMAATS